MSRTPDPLTPNLRRRRIAFATTVVASSAALLALMAAILFDQRVDALGLAMLAVFSVTLPWTTIGFWNAVIGLALMRFARDPEGRVAPHLRSIRGDEAITQHTALLVCIRHEDTDRLERNLRWMLDGLIRTGQAPWFHLYLLSDSDLPEVIESEQTVAATLRSRFGDQVRVTHRVRNQRDGFKAGNVQDFCERWGTQHAFAIVLDADSVMSPAAMLRLVRIMQAQPQIGILQTLVTGLPSSSPFARIFQFGMRLGMRSHTLGAASWQGDCGPYWGHNAILRLAPFTEHCHLPTLPGRPPLGGHILSHDQIEAVLMRRAGLEVRVIPQEDGSWEENPPALPEFIRRDLRWCQGNLQYLKLLRLPGLLPVSRCQIWLAIAMYAGAPAWLSLIALGLLRDVPVNLELFRLMFGITLLMTFSPKLATLCDVLSDPQRRRDHGGAWRIAISALIETAFTMLVAPIAAVSVAVFMLGLPFGRQVGWNQQQRDASHLAWSTALRCLWFHTMLGIALGAALWWRFPETAWLWAPMVAGLAGAIPLAVLSAHPGLGRWLAKQGLFRIPEETRLAKQPENAELFALDGSPPTPGAKPVPRGETQPAHALGSIDEAQDGIT